MFSASTSSVAFPQNSESKGLDEISNATQVVLRPPHLPFRRISLPGISHINGNLFSNRLSMVSTTSLESAGVREPSSTMSVSGESSKQAVSPKTRRRYTSSNHRLSKTTAVNQETKEKRRKIVNEILSTEQAYVNGLDLIYTVCLSFFFWNIPSCYDLFVFMTELSNTSYRISGHRASYPLSFRNYNFVF